MSLKKLGRSDRHSEQYQVGGSLSCALRAGLVKQQARPAAESWVKGLAFCTG